MFAVTAAEFTAEGTANLMINRYIPFWGCPSTLLSDSGLQFCASLRHPSTNSSVYTNSRRALTHPNGNGGVERVNDTVAQMLSMVCNEHQTDWDAYLPHVEYAYNNSVSATTGLAPMK